ncbi:hypothetical protein [Coleofasciculus sp. F4-SAH-05]|uniref:hypothetical protein n=1 Tax=Coleofasciculus sp. F4-SAH-05 TaxID=3069525 RepID=UPI00406471A5
MSDSICPALADAIFRLRTVSARFKDRYRMGQERGSRNRSRPCTDSTATVPFGRRVIRLPQSPGVRSPLSVVPHIFGVILCWEIPPS